MEYGVRPRFLCDAMVGRLARRLRMLGYDTAYRSVGDDRDLLCRAARERRVLITRDTRIRACPQGVRVLLLRENDTTDQLRELNAALRLSDPPALLRRCTVCNTLLRKARPEQVEARVPEYVRTMHADFCACHHCGRVYWPGTHRREMLRLLRLPPETRADAGRALGR